MKSINTLLFILVYFVSPAFSQYQKVPVSSEAASKHQLPVNPQKSAILTETGVMSSSLNPALLEWNPSLVSFSKVHELPENVAREIEAKTHDKILNRQPFYPDESSPQSPASSPQIGQNFAANVFVNMTPPDNSMAISNGGIIVSVVNSTVEYYTTTGTELFSSSFANLFNDATLTGTIYDPVVLYDSGSDRFFMVVLHGSNSTNGLWLRARTSTARALESPAWGVPHACRELFPGSRMSRSRRVRPPTPLLANCTATVLPSAPKPITATCLPRKGLRRAGRRAARSVSPARTALMSLTSSEGLSGRRRGFTRGGPFIGILLIVMSRTQPIPGSSPRWCCSGKATRRN